MSAKTIAAALVIATLAGVAGCGDDPARFSPTSPTPTPTTRSAPIATALTITGKTSSTGVNQWVGAWLGVVPGEVVRLTATARFSDGTERDVTAEALWTCPDQVGVVTVVSPGVIRSQVPGWESILARYGSAQSPPARAEAVLRVAPEGAFLLGVAVGDGRWATMDALVEVASLAGTFRARTSVWGIVSLPALGDTVVHVEKDGYRALSDSLGVDGDRFVEYTLQGPVTLRFQPTGR
jgi:hypothetical protein